MTHLMAFQIHVYQHSYTNIQVSMCSLMTHNRSHIYSFSFIFSVFVRFFLLYLLNDILFTKHRTLMIAFIAMERKTNQKLKCLGKTILSHSKHTCVSKKCTNSRAVLQNNNTQYELHIFACHNKYNDKIVADFQLVWHEMRSNVLFAHLFICSMSATFLNRHLYCDTNHHHHYYYFMLRYFSKNDALYCIVL